MNYTQGRQYYGSRPEGKARYFHNTSYAIKSLNTRSFMEISHVARLFIEHCFKTLIKTDTTKIRIANYANEEFIKIFFDINSGVSIVWEDKRIKDPKLYYSLVSFNEMKNPTSISVAKRIDSSAQGRVRTKISFKMTSYNYKENDPNNRERLMRTLLPQNVNIINEELSADRVITFLHNTIKKIQEVYKENSTLISNINSIENHKRESVQI